MAEAVSRPAITDWGIPDPRDAAAYPTPGETTWPQWGWQFLRRRQDYRQRWEQVVWPYITDDGGWDLEKEDRDGDEAAQLAYRGRRPFQWHHPFEILRDEFRICTTTLPGGNAALDPRLDRLPIFEGASVSEVLFQRQAVASEPPTEFDPQPPIEPQLKFDLRLPIEPQLAAAAQLLQERARRLDLPQDDITVQIDKLPRYLRILDFDGQKATTKEIGRNLFPHATGDRLQASIRDTRSAARQRQAEYLLIALRSSDS